MGVHGLWQLLQPAGRPIALETLDGKILAVGPSIDQVPKRESNMKKRSVDGPSVLMEGVRGQHKHHNQQHNDKEENKDVSIWLNKATKGMRDKFGNPIHNAHLIVIFHRICKLLFYKVKPIFVFDGGVPELKKKTIAARRERKLAAEGKAHKASKKILHNYLKGQALEAVTGRKGPRPTRIGKQAVPDIFDLPPMPVSSQTESSSEEDDNIDVESEWISGMRSENVEEMLEDVGAVEIDSEKFRALPAEIQHEVLMEMKDSYRRRYNRRKTQQMPEEATDFSDFQLKNLFRRGKITKKIDDVRKTMKTRSSGEIAEAEEGRYLGKNVKNFEANRISSEDKQHYILMKKEGKKGENMLFNTELEMDRIEIYEGVRKNENFDRLERDPVKFKDSLIDDSGIVSLMSDSTEDSDFDEEFSAVDARRMHEEAKSHHKRAEAEDINQDTGDRNQDAEDRVQGLKLVREDISQGAKAKVDNTNRIHLSSSSSSDIESNSEVDETSDNLDVSKKDRLVNLKHGVVSESDLNVVLNEKQEITLDDSMKASKEKISVNVAIEIAAPDDADFAKSSSFSIMSSIETAVSADIREDKLVTEVAESGAKGTASEGDVSAAIHKGSQMILDSSSDVKKVKDQIISKSLQDYEAEDIDNAISLTVETMIDSTNAAGQIVSNVTENDDGDVSAVPKPASSEDEDKMASDEEMMGREEIQQFKSSVVGQTTEGLNAMQHTLMEEQNKLYRERDRQTRAAATVTNEEYKDVQDLLRLFGIPFTVSPMEAEAQCAVLDIAGLTDGSITDDSDILLFGGKRVYKNIFNQEKYAELYTAEDINHTLYLDRDKMIALAYLTGSDYTEGVHGVGVITAMEILQEFGREPMEALIKLKQWFGEVKAARRIDLLEQETKLKAKLRSLELPKAFPNRHVWEAYINPTVDTSDEPFEWGKPDLEGIRDYAREKFGWRSARTDEVLLPAIKQLNTNQGQTSLRKYFTETMRVPERQLASKRLQRTVNLLRSGVTGATEDNIIKPKPMKRSKVERGENSNEGRSNERKSSEGASIECKSSNIDEADARRETSREPAGARSSPTAMTNLSNPASLIRAIQTPYMMTSDIARRKTYEQRRIPTNKDFQKRIAKSKASSRGRRRMSRPMVITSSKLPQKRHEPSTTLDLSGSSSDSDA